MSDIRYNLLDDSYVIIAPERLQRPLELRLERRGNSSKGGLNCPFCEGNEDVTTPEIFSIRPSGTTVNSVGWQTRVIPNLYKAVGIETAYASHHEGIYHSLAGFGAHEIIIDTPKHNHAMDAWSVEEYMAWFETMQHRITNLRNDHRLVSITLFKNHGIKAGASQSHPHTQLIALPLLPKQIEHQYRRFYQHFIATGRLLIEDIIVQEYQDGRRIIADNSNFVAFCPYASAYPFEVIIVAKEGLTNIETMNKIHLEELSTLLKEVMMRLNKQLGDFDFNLSISVPPLHKTVQTEDYFDSIDKINRFFMRITPRMYQHAGFEVSTQTMINPVCPEEAARLLRLCKCEDNKK